MSRNYSGSRRFTCPALPSFGDDSAIGRRFVEFADYLIRSRLQRADLDGGFRFSGDDFFTLQRMALEFLRRGVSIVHDERDGPARGNLQFRRVDAVVLEHDVEILLRPGGIENRQRDSQQDDRHADANEHGLWTYTD